MLSSPISPECEEGVCCEVGLSLLLLGVCGPFFLDDLQTLDHLEGEAHYAALLALVLEVDCLVVVVDEYLRHKPAVVVQPLRSLWDIFVLYLLGLLAHPRLLLPSIVFLYPEEALFSPQKEVLEPLFSQVPRNEVLGSSSVGRRVLLPCVQTLRWGAWGKGEKPHERTND